jgi:hypothetical protein
MQRKSWTVIILAVLLITLLAACKQRETARTPAVLEGKVTVGPLSPVEHAPEPGVIPSSIPAEVFTSRSVLIFQEDGKTLVKTVSFNPDGTYRVELPPGTYVVAMPSGKFESARDLPKTVTLKAGETVQLDIDIDTGIR